MINNFDANKKLAAQVAVVAKKMSDIPLTDNQIEKIDHLDLTATFMALIQACEVRGVTLEGLIGGE